MDAKLSLDQRTKAAVHPSLAAVAGMPISTNFQIATQELNGLGPRVIDLGCGEGKFTLALAGHFGDVIGLDIEERLIGRANKKAREAGANVHFISGSAGKIPYKSGVFDAVIFSNSLHHISDPAGALREAIRVLRESGLLYVMEPVPSGNYHDATYLVIDETQVRTDAYAALLAAPGVIEKKEILYRALRCFDSFDHWLNEQIIRDPMRQALYDRSPEQVRANFENNAVMRDAQLVFDQVFRVNVLEKC